MNTRDVVFCQYLCAVIIAFAIAEPSFMWIPMVLISFVFFFTKK